MSKETTLKNKILFLGYSESETKLINELRLNNYEVTTESDVIKDTRGFDYVISYGYRHIISKEVILKSETPILNIHLSYLPYNRGSHPNFWAHFENTPHGVSIHVIDEGIDTGPILFQKYVNFEKSDNTFEKTYDKLRAEAEKLFLENLNQIFITPLEVTPQRGIGSSHKTSDLPSEFLGWHSIILEEIARLDSISENSQAKKLKIIDQIEQVRSVNNVNWMNLLRVVAVKSPKDLQKIVGQIRGNDESIFKLLKELGEWKMWKLK